MAVFGAVAEGGAGCVRGCRRLTRTRGQAGSGRGGGSQGGEVLWGVGGEVGGWGPTIGAQGERGG